MGFMRHGPGEDNASPATSTQRQRRGASGRRGDDDVEEGGDEGDPFDWEWLGRAACFPKNSRPGLSGFLLGPLSVQKRSRQMTQRRARQERIDPTQAIRPNELQNADLEKKETANLTQLCASIHKTLSTLQTEGLEKVEKELSERSGEVSEDEALEIMDKHGIADDKCIPLFRFCINPQSFGQTVENIFYVSFLIRDGFIGVSEDSNQLPTLRKSTPLFLSLYLTYSITSHSLFPI